MENREVNTKPTQEMSNEAAQALEWRAEFGRGGTEVGVARARDLKNRKNLSLKTIKRMFSYFSRHEVDKQAEGFRPGEDGYPSAGRIAWGLWGGDPGFAWTKRKIKEFENEQNSSNMSNKETRYFDIKNLEVRAEDNGTIVVGYGAVFNTESNDLGGFYEVISPSAFDGRTDDDVRFLLNHDPNFIFGRTTAGTLNLSTDTMGLRYEVTLPDTQSAKDLYTSLERGDITQSSFAFMVEEDSWEQVDDRIVRTINKVSRLYDVSAVVYPAYEEASVGLRSLEEWKENRNKEKLEKNLAKEILENKEEELDLHKRNLAELRLKIKSNN